MNKYLEKLRNRVKELNESIKAKRAEGEVDNITLDALKKVNEELRKLCDERDAVQKMIDEIIEAIAESGNTDPKPEDMGKEAPPMEGGRISQELMDALSAHPAADGRANMGIHFNETSTNTPPVVKDVIKIVK